MNTPRPMSHTTGIPDAALIAIALHGALRCAAVRARLADWGYDDASSALASALSWHAKRGILRALGPTRKRRYDLGDAAPAWAWLLREVQR